MPMNTPIPFDIVTQSAQQTYDLGQFLGQRIQGAVTLRLSGDLGSGKTCFVKGLANGLAVPEEYAVTSPSYTLINEYSGRLPLFHVDLYRLAAPVEADSLGLDEIFSDIAVVAVEWSERLAQEDWPDQTIAIHFTIQDDTARLIRINGSGLENHNLIKEIVTEWAQIINSAPSL